MQQKSWSKLFRCKGMKETLDVSLLDKAREPCRAWVLLRAASHRSFPTGVCPAPLLVQTQRCFRGLLASSDKTRIWSQLGIPPTHFSLTSHVFPVFPPSSWCSCAVTMVSHWPNTRCPWKSLAYPYSCYIWAEVRGKN